MTTGPTPLQKKIPCKGVAWVLPAWGASAVPPTAGNTLRKQRFTLKRCFLYLVGVAWGATQWHRRQHVAETTIHFEKVFPLSGGCCLGCPPQHRRQHVAETTIHFEKVLPGCGLGSGTSAFGTQATPWKHSFLVIINPVNLVIAVPVSQKKPS